MSKRDKAVAGKKKKPGKKNQKRIQEDINEDESENHADNNDMMNPDLQNQKDADRISLTDEQKEEVILKTLNSNNLWAPHNYTQYSYKEKIFKRDDMIDQMVIHFKLNNDIIQHDSKEYRDQINYFNDKKAKNKAFLDFKNTRIMRDEEMSNTHSMKI